MSVAIEPLSKAEVRRLTRTPIKVRQVAFFRQNGIRHYLDSDGWPVVLRSAVESGDTAVMPKAWKPNKAA